MSTLSLAEARIVARLLTMQLNKEHLFYVKDNHCITDIFGGRIDAYGPVVSPPPELYRLIEDGQFDGEVHTHPMEFTFSNRDVVGFMYRPFQFAEVITRTQIFRLEKPEGWRATIPYGLFRFIDWGDINRLNDDSYYREQMIKSVVTGQGLIYKKIE